MARERLISIMESIFYQSLGCDKKFYDEALKSITNKKRGFSLGGYVDSMVILSHVLDDHPELFYVSQEFKKKYSFLGKEIQFKYIYTSSDEKQIRSELERVAHELLGNLVNAHQSEYDKIRNMHDYLKNNLQYDMNAVGNSCLSNRHIAESHTIVGALLNHKCVCEGFAKAMKYLCDKVGIECWVVSGKGSSSVATGSHSWNIVKINGCYHHVDVTWDNQYAETSNTPNYGYLNLSDDEIAKDHTWERKYYPACPISPYNYFRVNDALIDSKNQLEKFLYNSFQMEEECIMFRVVRGSALEGVVQGCLQDSIQNAIHRCKHIDMRQWRYSQIPEQLTFYIHPQYIYCD